MSDESAAWIERQYIEWQRPEGKRATLTAFAKYLGVSRNVLNNWINRKQTPEGDSLRLLGDKLGWEIYDVVGEPRPDPRLQAILKVWGRLSEEVRSALYAEAERMAALGAEEPAVAAPKRRSKN